MQWLNKLNGADLIEIKYTTKCMEEFEGDLTAVVMGSAYGGCLEAMGKLLKDRGKVYGCDTFEDMHPVHLAPTQGGFEATCMNHWYNREDYGTDRLAYDYQRKELDKQGLDNVILIKGEVGPHTVKDLDKIHYAFLDMDMPKSMDNGYQAVKNKIVKGGYIMFHDTQNIGSLTSWYNQEVRLNDKKMWKVVGDLGRELLKVLQKQ